MHALYVFVYIYILYFTQKTVSLTHYRASNDRIITNNELEGRLCSIF
jgi:hypothetical protein